MRREGFTLLEVLAVILLTSIVLGVAIDFYLDLSRASNRAAGHTREIRLATAVLDRIARDFELTLLVEKPSDVDPLAHPWLFLGESEYAEDGSDRVKFITRNHRPRTSDASESDLALVAYTLAPEEESYRLLRWASPQLPESLDRSFPSPSDEANVLMAEGLASFSVKFVDESGDASDTWDSTTLVDSSDLPAAVDISVALADPEADEFAEPRTYSRRVRLPVRPLDLEALLDPTGTAGGEEEDDDDGEEGDDDASDDSQGDDDEPQVASKTLADCVNTSATADLDPTANIMGQVLLQIATLRGSDPWEMWQGEIPPELHPFIQPDCL